MKYNKLGRTDLNVSSLCLGTMTWGEQNSEAEAFEQLDYAVTEGINFIDTAELYAIPPKPETYGLTETIIGRWLSRQKRDQLIIATKIAGPGPSYIDGGRRFNKEHIDKAVEGSLKRLQTDYIDLYQLHWPDRSTNTFGKLGYQHNANETKTSIEETLEALGQHVRAGRIRHIGLSNETPWGTMSFLQKAVEHNQPRIVSIQNPYNLLNRTYEVGMAEISHREQCGLLAYSPMAFGALSGKYLNGARPDNARLTLFQRFQRYNNPQALAAITDYVQLARDNNLDPAQMSLAWVTSRPFVTSNIIGATTMEQLQHNIASADLTLSDQVTRGIAAIHTRHPNPSP